MKVLVTGANGFLGREVVAKFLQRGHEVRALVRPSTIVDRISWRDKVDFFRTDLRVGQDLLAAFNNIDAVVHLASAVTDSKETLFSSTVTGTERLLAAMAKSGTKHLVLASSFAVYDWSQISGVLTEDSPIESDIYKRDEYTIAKYWQERVARAASEQNGWNLTVLRPGLIWGHGSEHRPAVGPGLGRNQVVIGPFRHLPLTYVVNCADCFVSATENPRALGQTFNVIDGHDVTAWRYARELMRLSGKVGWRIPLPYWVGFGLTQMVEQTSKAIFNGKGKLPSLLVPNRYEARFMRVRYSDKKLRTTLEWRPPLSFEECLYQARAKDQVSLLAPTPGTWELNHV